jgi:hypothetical protein
MGYIPHALGRPSERKYCSLFAAEINAFTLKAPEGDVIM